MIGFYEEGWGFCRKSLGQAWGAYDAPTSEPEEAVLAGTCLYKLVRC